MNIEKRDDGLWWPAYDQLCYPWTETEHWIPEFLINSCREVGRPLRSIVHAGGNIGKYTKEFAKSFQMVYTFEPDATNFRCLSLNCGELDNVFMYRACLGKQNSTTTLDNPVPESCGNIQTTGTQGNVPVLTIDNLSLADVDLIHLDIEGYELFALQGATETIQRTRPLLAFEISGAYRAYNYDLNTLNEFMLSIGYTKSRQYGNEIMFYYEN